MSQTLTPAPEAASNGDFPCLIKNRQLLVVEAKQGDLSCGFKQLGAELAALDQWTNSPTTLLYGAITIGDVWRFGLLKRQSKTNTQDVALFTVPNDLDVLLAILVAILCGEDATATKA